MALENRVAEDVRGYILDQLDEYDEEHLKGVYASEIGWDVMSEANANGSITCSRNEAHAYLKANPMATDSIIQKMIHEYGYDWEDIYENGEDYEDYILYNAEKVHVILYIDVANAIFSECPTVQLLWNDTFRLYGDGILQKLISEVQAVPAGNIEI